MPKKKKTEKDLKIVVYHKGTYYELDGAQWQAGRILEGVEKSPGKAVVKSGKKVKYVPTESGATGVGGYSTILNLDAVLGIGKK
jgi:hypothetical protein